MEIEQAFAENRRFFLKQAGSLTLGAGAVGMFTGSVAGAAAPRTSSDVGVIQTALECLRPGRR